MYFVFTNVQGPDGQEFQEVEQDGKLVGYIRILEQTPEWKFRYVFFGVNSTTSKYESEDLSEVQESIIKDRAQVRLVTESETQEIRRKLELEPMTPPEHQQSWYNRLRR